MKNLSKTIARAVLTLAVAGVGMVLSAGEASAAAIVFSVEEGVVPGAINSDPTGTEIDATDNIEGQYGELLTLTPSAGACPAGTDGCGTFDADIFVDFNDYNLGSTPLASQLGVAIDGGETDPTCTSDPGCGGTNLYGLYALVEAGGTYTYEQTAGGTLYTFFATTSDAAIYLDPERDTLKSATGPTANDTFGANEDVQIMSAGTLDPSLSIGTVLVSNTGQVLVGGFTLVYTDPVLINSGPAYWPTLSALTLEATATGQVHTPTSNFGTGEISGSVNLSFNQAPEPASMALLGLGFLGAGFAARRRRTS